jgi:nucleotide-binding universal stress UspA family protein
MAESEALDRREGRELLAQAAKKLGHDVDTELVEPSSPAKGLARLAAQRQAGMLVLGSSHRGAVGRIVPGGVASRLLARAPCAVAVAPVAYARDAPAATVRVGIAYDGTSASDVALAAAASAATELGVPLQLYHAMHAVSADPSWDKFRAHMREFAQRILDTGLERLPPELEAATSVLEGDAAEVVAEAAYGDNVGLLYAGSRGYGPLREALLAGFAGALLRAARCPLVLVPRSAGRASASQRRRRRAPADHS